MESQKWDGEVCKRCLRRNNVGFDVPDGIWNQVTQGRWNVLCTTCFDEEAQAAGVRYAFLTVWPVTWNGETVRGDALYAHNPYEGHTPGPWRLDDLNDCSVVDKSEGYHCIAAGGNFESSNPESGIGFSITGYMSESNARLIADAPLILAERDRLKKDLAVAEARNRELVEVVKAFLYADRQEHLIVRLNDAETAAVEQMKVLVNGGQQAPAYYDLIAHLHKQRAWSEKTFGPGPRTVGILDHIQKELKEIEAEPSDVTEWIDVVMLALDGAWRSNHTPEQIAKALDAKLTQNKNREWPDWRASDANKAIEHVKPSQPSPSPVPPDTFTVGGCNENISLSERMDRLLDVLYTIRIETQPINGHTDPGALNDCWALTYETLDSIKSKARAIVFTTWQTAIDKGRTGSGPNYDQWIDHIGLRQFAYLPFDNLRPTTPPVPSNFTVGGWAVCIDDQGITPDLFENIRYKIMSLNLNRPVPTITIINNFRKAGAYTVSRFRPTTPPQEGGHS